jgi:hypothetical protein
MDLLVAETAAAKPAAPPAPADRPRTVALRVDPAQLRGWHLDLVRRLESERIGRVVAVQAGMGRPLPSSVELLLGFDRMMNRHKSASGDRIPLSAFGRPDEASEKPEVVLDLSGTADEDGAKILRVLFDGVADEAALIGALLEGRAPLVTVADESGLVLASGLPSTENAEGLCGAIEIVYARVGTLIEAALRRPRPQRASAVTPRHRGSAAQVAAYLRKTLAFAAVRRLYRLCCHAPHWRVGWRFAEGPGLIERQTLEGSAWNVLPDPGDHFYADPFPFVWRGRRFVFVEDLDHRTQKGIISAVEFGPQGPVGPMTPVLEEPWHLSYPFLIEDDGAIWMIPESSANRRVSLYRADPFPQRWVKEADLLTGIEASDATIVRHGGRYWMFAAVRDGGGAYSDVLCLFSAPRLVGPWTPHPLNPVLVDAQSARPAGNVVSLGGRLWRPVQDCRGGYGSALGIAEITRLDEEGFEQSLRAILRPGAQWPGRRFHTLNSAGSLECIDGSGHSPKLKLAARTLHAVRR